MAEKRYGDGGDVGDILYSSWGYDQTNIDFYEVVRRTEKSVWLRKRGKRLVKNVGWAMDQVAPGGPLPEAKVFRRKAKTSGRFGIYVSLTSYSGAWPWDKDRESVLETSYA